jgi:SET domain-containing protein
MLLVEAYAGKSSIEGLGLIARAAIPANTCLWIMQPGFDVELTESQWRELSPMARAQVEKYTYIDIETGHYILCSDDAKYMNHSDTPNTVNRPDSTWTTRDIAAGEELTTDYREFDLPSRDRVGRLY